MYPPESLGRASESIGRMEQVPAGSVRVGKRSPQSLPRLSLAPTTPAGRVWRRAGAPARGASLSPATPVETDAAALAYLAPRISAALRPLRTGQLGATANMG